MNKIKEYRKKQNIDLTSLAVAAGISKRHLQFIEKGERLPSLPVAKRISDCLCDNIDNVFYNNK